MAGVMASSTQPKLAPQRKKREVSVIAQVQLLASKFQEEDIENYRNPNLSIKQEHPQDLSPSAAPRREVHINSRSHLVAGRRDPEGTRTKQFFKLKKIKEKMRMKERSHDHGYLIKRHHAQPSHDLVLPKKRQVTNTSRNLFNYQHVLDKDRIQNSRTGDLEEILAEKVKMLKRPPISVLTIQQHNIHHKYFNNLMDNLGKEAVPTVATALELIADMDMHNYSTLYIGRAVSTLKVHPKISMDPDELTFHPDIKAALQNIRKSRPVVEDTRIPITPALIREFSKVADRDFSSVMAITMKAILWFAFTCMLRQGKICINTREDSAIQMDNTSCTPHGFGVTFHGWKLKAYRHTIKFPYVHGTRNEAYHAMNKYLKLRKAREIKEKTLFVNDKGTPFNVRNFAPSF